MDLPRNAFKHALAEGRQQLGLWSQLSNGIAAEIIAGCGFDWIVLDMEHGPNEVASVITQLQAMTDIMRTSVAPTRASMLLLVIFAAVAMVMAAVGVFGVMSYTVTLRAREMGIRLALGAQPSEVRRMVLMDGMKQALAGIAIGIAGAAGLTRMMTTMLFGVRPGDPLTLGIVATLLLATAALACYLPARRATIDSLVVFKTT